MSVTETPRFGSEAWVEQQLLIVLQRARQAVDECHRENQAIAHNGVDYDHYAYARVSRKQKKLWAMLQNLSKEHCWISLSADSDVLDIWPSIEIDNIYSKNAEGSVARAIVKILKEEGIEARLEEHWR